MSNEHFSLMTPADLPKIPHVQPADWSDITPAFMYYTHSPHCEALKLERDGKLIALGAVIWHEHTAWLAHILVHETMRGQGIGKQMTAALMKRIDRSTHPRILLIATDLGEPVYRRLGFEVEMEYAAYRWEDGALEAPVMPCIPYTTQWKEALLKLDAWVSCESRQAVLEEHLEAAQLITEGQELLGAYLPTLGDGMIIARDAIAGCSLMAKRISDQSFAVMPDTNTPALDYMTSLGLEPYKRVKRMYLGSKLTWNPQGLYNRIGGNLG